MRAKNGPPDSGKLTGKTNAHHCITVHLQIDQVYLLWNPFNAIQQYSTFFDAILFFPFLNGFLSCLWCADAVFVVFCLCAFWFQLRIFSHIMWTFDCGSAFPLAVRATPLHHICTNISYKYIEFAHVTWNSSEDGVGRWKVDGVEKHIRKIVYVHRINCLTLFSFFAKDSTLAVGRCWQNRHFGYVPRANHFYQKCQWHLQLRLSFELRKPVSNIALALSISLTHIPVYSRNFRAKREDFVCFFRGNLSPFFGFPRASSHSWMHPHFTSTILRPYDISYFDAPLYVTRVI